jgi:hypothetical protein
VTIARITLGTIAPIRIEIRAQRRGNHYAYRIVDGLGRAYRPFHPVSSLPLMLGELCEILDESVESGSDGESGEERGLVLPVLQSVFGGREGECVPRYRSAGDRSALADAVRAFVRVESEIYPGLASYVEAQVDDWLESIGCLSIPDGLPGVTARDWGPVAPAISARNPVAGPQAAAIERLLRAWWRSQEAPETADGALELAGRVSRLRRALRRHASRYGRLPAGRFEVAACGPRTERWVVEIDDLTESGELIERILLEGTRRDLTLAGWPEGPASQVAAYAFGDGVYLVHPCGIDGPYDELPDFSDAETFSSFCEQFTDRPGALVAENEGYARMSVYRVLGAFVTIDENGFHGPYPDFETAVGQQDIYWIHETTSRIWDREHGVVFEGGILFHPEVVERYGAINASGVIRRGE